LTALRALQETFAKWFDFPQFRQDFFGRTSIVVMGRLSSTLVVLGKFMKHIIVFLVANLKNW
jgi:hypothetical protein